MVKEFSLFYVCRDFIIVCLETDLLLLLDCHTFVGLQVDGMKISHEQYCKELSDFNAVLHIEKPIPANLGGVNHRQTIGFAGLQGNPRKSPRF